MLSHINVFIARTQNLYTRLVMVMLLIHDHVNMFKATTHIHRLLSGIHT